MQRRGRHAPVSVVPSTHELRPGMHSAAPSESNAALHHQDQFDGDPVSGVHMRGPWSVRSQSRSASGSGVHRRWQHKRDSAPAIMPREHFEGRDHVMRVQSAHGSSAVFQQVLVEVREGRDSSRLSHVPLPGLFCDASFPPAPSLAARIASVVANRHRNAEASLSQEGAPRQRALHAAGSLDRAQAMDAAEEAAAVAAALLGGKGERGERGEGAARGGGKGEGGGEGRLGQGGVLVESDAEGEGAGVRGEGSVSGEDESEGGSGAPRPHGKGSGLPDEQSAFGSIMLESRSGRRLFHPEASTSDGESQGQSEREERSQVSSGRKSPMSDGGAGRAGANGGGGAYSSDSGARKKERGLDGTGSRGMALAGMGSFDFDGGRLPEEIAEGEREGEEGDEERVEEGEEGER